MSKYYLEKGSLMMVSTETAAYVLEVITDKSHAMCNNTILNYDLNIYHVCRHVVP
jgi:hypothetical protein